MTNKNKYLGILLMASTLSATAMVPSTYHYGNDIFGINKVFDYADRKIDRMLADLDTQKSFYNNDMFKYFDNKTKSYVVMVNTNGYEAGDLSVSVKNRVLSISGKASEETKSTNKFSSNHGSFNYSITLPKDANEVNVASEYKNGVLYVRFPQKSETQLEVRQIKISTPTQ
jgi:HSP20 family molecular chaperone IbpA